MKKLYYIDFDNTLFNSHEFFQDFSTVLATYFHVDGAEIRSIARRHNEVRQTAKGIFSAFEMMRSEFPDIVIDDVKRITAQELSGRSYVFADVKQTLQRLEKAGGEIRMITVGLDEYQKFKLDFAPILGNYPLTVTQQTKGACLAQHKDSFSQYDEVVLVDDRGDTFDDDFRALGITGIRLNRVDSTHEDKLTPDDIKEITTLVELAV